MVFTAERVPRAILHLILGTAGIADAQGVFLPATDIRLREDISLLADSGCLRLAVDEWPLPRDEVAGAIAAGHCDGLPDAALQAALARVVRRTAARADAGNWRIRATSFTAGQPALLREYDTLGREHGELNLSGGASTGRYDVTLSVTGAADPADGQHVRLDGSDASLRLGNWLLGLNQIDRWWGPGFAGSLILSNNARPMPAISLDRIRSPPPVLPWLRWLGPWRFSWFFALGEQHRPDVDQPLFMGMRLSFKPSPWLELGLSRSAQFCGKGRRCTPLTFGRMLVGEDNVQENGVNGLNNPSDEPGNQMSGFDLRLTSPWKALPAVLYGQAIGEDNSQLSLPIRYLIQLGAQTWWTLGGTTLRGYVEFTDTATNVYGFWHFRDPSPGFRTDYAYRNHIFFAGYTYRGRTIGHTTDSDSKTTTTGLSLTASDGARWAVQWLESMLDRRGIPDIYDPVTFGPSHYHSLQLSWDGKVLDQDISVQIGHQRQAPSSAGSANGLFGFLQWRKALD
ncbi:MAG TPA: capsule assembly Wzi family protein [Steroidobacteraceae bacterium]|nr:capsule assembly Wzi family protein [Steroidobacteraceae bacterium]